MSSNRELWLRYSLMIAALFLATFPVTKSCAQSNPSAAAQTLAAEHPVLKERLEKACREYSLPAIWAGKFVVGQPAVMAVAGVRKYDEPELAQVDDIVHLGSCTKAMTAALIGQLCTQGKLQLDMPLRNALADVPGLNDSPWGDVTIAELMQHRSGAPANLIYLAYDAKHPNSPKDARRSLLEHLCTMERPRSRGFLYSNVGYTLLGHVAETIAGQPWETLIQERLFDRLSIRSAGLGPVGKPDGSAGTDILPGRPWGHVESVKLAELAKSVVGEKAERSLEPRQIDNSPCIGPAGRVHMNLQDWSRFVILYSSTEGYSQLGISEDIWTTMLTPADSQAKEELYAAGWILFNNQKLNGKGLFHNGSNTTWYSYAVASPEKHQCILVATNTYSNLARKGCDEISRYLNSLPVE